ncbi:hypothetical protein KCU90_g150, partial [Aureobasidium melanogenum]
LVKEISSRPSYQSLNETFSRIPSKPLESQSERSEKPTSSMPMEIEVQFLGVHSRRSSLLPDRLNLSPLAAARPACITHTNLHSLHHTSRKSREPIGAYGMVIRCAPITRERPDPLRQVKASLRSSNGLPDCSRSFCSSSMSMSHCIWHFVRLISLTCLLLAAMAISLAGFCSQHDACRYPPMPPNSFSSSSQKDP